MNLYIWDGPGVLERYGSGMAGALAESEEQARELIRAKLMAWYQDLYALPPDRSTWDSFQEDLWGEEIDQALRFLDHPPIQSAAVPHAFYQWGSE